METIIGLLPCMLVLGLTLIGLIIALVGEYNLTKQFNQMEEEMKDIDHELYCERIHQLCEKKLEERRQQLLLQQRLAPTMYAQPEDVLDRQVAEYLFDLSDAPLAA